MNVREKRTCPKCGKEYTGRPAVSRMDNKTLICPICGTREALQTMQLDPDEIDQIVEIVERNCHAWD